jgi:nitrite reductase/ring-hydroxylating ferredoxin subunit
MTAQEPSLVSGRNWIQRQVLDLPGWGGMTERVTEAIIEGVAGLKGPAAARTLRQIGLQRLHEVIGAGDVGPLRDLVVEPLRQSLLAMTVAVGRTFLGWEGEFFVDDYLVLRIYFPYEFARKADPSAENAGVGRVTPRVRALFNARKTIDPVFDPRGYHLGHPPAAWANGPHRDSWTGHSREGRNIWWAVADVPAEAGIVFYPELTEATLPCDPRTFYLKAGYPLPKPTCLPLKAGEMLVFDGDLLHATHLNTSDVTRVAVSTRLNAARPAFEPACFFAREFWRRASDIERGRDEILHLRREDHLGPARSAEPAPPRGVLPVIAGTLDTSTGIVRTSLGEASAAGRIIVEAAPYRIMLICREEGLSACDAACPHYGLDLADGGADSDQLFCPACGVGFNLQTGQSSCQALSLRVYEAWRDGGAVLIRTIP